MVLIGAGAQRAMLKQWMIPHIGFGHQLPSLPVQPAI
jgi:hypothetical protein